MFNIIILLCEGKNEKVLSKKFLENEGKKVETFELESGDKKDQISKIRETSSKKCKDYLVKDEGGKSALQKVVLSLTNWVKRVDHKLKLFFDLDTGCIENFTDKLRDDYSRRRVEVDIRQERLEETDKFIFERLDIELEKGFLQIEVLATKKNLEQVKDELGKSDEEFIYENKDVLSKFFIV